MLTNRPDLFFQNRTNKLAFLFIVLLFFNVPNLLAASGSISITSHDVSQQPCVTGNFAVSGSFIVTEDNTPNETVLDSPYCNTGSKPDRYIPFIVLPMSNRTHANLYYQIDSLPSRHLKRVESSYLTGWTHIGQARWFSFTVPVSTLSPGFHTLKVYLEDMFGVYCYRYSYARGYSGEIFANQILSFYVSNETKRGCGQTQDEANQDPGKPCPLVLLNEK